MYTTGRGARKAGQCLPCCTPRHAHPTPRSSKPPLAPTLAHYDNDHDRPTRRTVRPSAPKHTAQPVYGRSTAVSAVPHRRKQAKTLTSRTRAGASAPPLRRRTASRVTAQERKRAPTLPAQARSTAHRTQPSTTTPVFASYVASLCRTNVDEHFRRGKGRRRARTFNAWSMDSVAGRRRG